MNLDKLNSIEFTEIQEISFDLIYLKVEFYELNKNLLEFHGITKTFQDYKCIKNVWLIQQNICYM